MDATYRAVIELCDKHNLYVHEFDSDDDILLQLPLVDRVGLTHYLMQGSNILHKGNKRTLCYFVLCNYK